MTEERQAEDRATTEVKRTYSVRAIHHAIDGFAPGDQAQLRRDPGTALAFYKLQAKHFPKVENPDTLDRWVRFVQAVAHLSSLYSPEVKLGEALAKARLSEGRLTRLLRADGPRLSSQIYACARFLASKGVRQDMNGFGQLLGVHSWMREPRAAENIRRKIAGDYFKALQ